MTKNRIFKIIVTFLIGVTLIMSFSQIASGININLDKFDNSKDESEATNHVSNIISATINFTQIIGAGIAIMMIVVFGIKYVGASPDGKAELRKDATIYIIGAILIFAAVSLLQIVKNFAEKDIVEKVNKAITKT